MYLKEAKNFLSKDNINFIENVILTNKFPFYLENKILEKQKTNDAWFSHRVLERLENNKDITKALCTSQEIYNQTLDILYNFCNKIKEKPNFFLRINYNLSFNNGNKESRVHIDHKYYHKQIIIYLNDFDKKAGTHIYDDSESKIIKTLIPEKYKGFCFENLSHEAIHPDKHFRVVLTATFI